MIAAMGRRQRLISASILRAIFKTKSRETDKPPTILGRILAFFSVFYISLSRYKAALFKKLRNEIWEIDEEEYTESFRSPSKGKRTDLISIGDLGYSGSVSDSDFQVQTSLLICLRLSSLLQIRSTFSSLYLAPLSNHSSASVFLIPMLSTWN